MNALLVCVDYADLLALTLPYNRHHFDRVLVVTDEETYRDLRFREVVYAPGAGCRVHVTDAFYRNGADFNKWAAVEEGLDVLGRSGWLAVMDADVCWPKELTNTWRPDREYPGFGYREGCLYTPRRRMHPGIPAAVPPETTWGEYPRDNNPNEWAGYLHVFHAADPVLAARPWYDTGWRHAGGGDSLFQERWPPARKVRPPFDVLHLGPAGANWCGRATPRADGSTPPGAAARRARLDFLKSSRRRKSWRDNDSPERI